MSTKQLKIFEISTCKMCGNGQICQYGPIGHRSAIVMAESEKQLEEKYVSDAIQILQNDGYFMVNGERVKLVNKLSDLSKLKFEQDPISLFRDGPDFEMFELNSYSKYCLFLVEIIAFMFEGVDDPPLKPKEEYLEFGGELSDDIIEFMLDGEPWVIIKQIIHEEICSQTLITSKFESVHIYG